MTFSVLIWVLIKHELRLILIDHIEAERVFDQEAEQVGWLLDLFQSLADTIIPGKLSEKLSNEDIVKPSLKVEPVVKKAVNSPIKYGTLGKGQVSTLVNDIPNEEIMRKETSPAKKVREKTVHSRDVERQVAPSLKKSKTALSAQYQELTRTSRDLDLNMRKKIVPKEASTEDKVVTEEVSSEIEKRIQSAIPGMNIPTWLKNRVESRQRTALMASLHNALIDRKVAKHKRDLIALENERLQKMASIQRENLSRKPEFGTLIENEVRSRHEAVVRMQRRQRDIEQETKAFQVRRDAQEELMAKRIIDQTLREQRESIIEQRKQEKEARQLSDQQKKLKLEAKQTVLRNRVDMMKEKLEHAKHDQRLQTVAAKSEIHRAKQDEKKLLKRRIEIRKTQLNADGHNY